MLSLSGSKYIVRPELFNWFSIVFMYKRMELLRAFNSSGIVVQLEAKSGKVRIQDIACSSRLKNKTKYNMAKSKLKV